MVRRHLNDVWLDPFDSTSEKTDRFNNCLFRALIPNKQTEVLCNDRLQVEVDLESLNQGFYSATWLERKPPERVFYRAYQNRQFKKLASFVDQVALILAPLPLASNLLIDSFLAWCRFLAIKPMLVFHKMDLLDQSHAERQPKNSTQFSHQRHYYQAISEKAKTGVKTPR